MTILSREAATALRSLISFATTTKAVRGLRGSKEQNRSHRQPTADRHLQPPNLCDSAVIFRCSQRADIGGFTSGIGNNKTKKSVITSEMAKLCWSGIVLAHFSSLAS